ncbi:hypothetical protein GCK32_012869 [Trichostrongylus colubriformis]|uniref:Uncharacterized protein n=1 Tax=Trichostrongylus colubriformis TaxID=6319 RepID=A0AAN8IGK2_TRICO
MRGIPTSASTTTETSETPPTLKPSSSKAKGGSVLVSRTTEAHAHYMLAKRVLTEAGGSHSRVVVAIIL